MVNEAVIIISVSVVIILAIFLLIIACVWLYLCLGQHRENIYQKQQINSMSSKNLYSRHHFSPQRSTAYYVQERADDYYDGEKCSHSSDEGDERKMNVKWSRHSDLHTEMETTILPVITKPTIRKVYSLSESDINILPHYQISTGTDEFKLTKDTTVKEANDSTTSNEHEHQNAKEKEQVTRLEEGSVESHRSSSDSASSISHSLNDPLSTTNSISSSTSHTISNVEAKNLPPSPRLRRSGRHEDIAQVHEELGLKLNLNQQHFQYNLPSTTADNNDGNDNILVVTNSDEISIETESIRDKPTATETIKEKSTTTDIVTPVITIEMIDNELSLTSKKVSANGHSRMSPLVRSYKASSSSYSVSSCSTTENSEVVAAELCTESIIQTCSLSESNDSSDTDDDDDDDKMVQPLQVTTAQTTAKTHYFAAPVRRKKMTPPPQFDNTKFKMNQQKVNQSKVKENSMTIIEEDLEEEEDT